MSETKATPRPWTPDKYGHPRGADGEIVTLDNFSMASGYVPPENIAVANTALVLEAVNSHEKQQKTIEALVDALEMHMRWVGPPPQGPREYDSLREDAWAKGKLALRLVGRKP